MFELAFHHRVWQAVERADPGLRGACKAHLVRLRLMRQGVGSLRIEKVDDKIWELKISWNKQEFRFLWFYGSKMTIYLVCFFQKKTRKTPPSEIEVANARMREIQLEQAAVVSRELH